MNRMPVAVSLHLNELFRVTTLKSTTEHIRLIYVSLDFWLGVQDQERCRVDHCDCGSVYSYLIVNWGNSKGDTGEVKSLPYYMAAFAMLIDVANTPTQEIFGIRETSPCFTSTSLKILVGSKYRAVCLVNMSSGVL